MDIYSTFQLPNDKRSIRLLALEPSRNDDSLVICRFRVVALDQSRSYEALSYTWGVSNDRDVISVGGNKISVNLSLATALHALRHPIEERTLWIDAICINETDNIEKSFQVPLMALIYRNCSRTVIWLDESKKDSRKAFRLLRIVVKEYPRILSKVLHRPWFRRVWIIQEVASTPTALVQCGNDTVG